MKKAQENLIFFLGVLLISMIAIVFVVNKTVGLQSSSEGQAKVMANMIAISVNSLSTMDAGYVQKSFDVKQPLTVEVYDKNGVMYVKVIYDTANNKFYETPLLVKVGPIAPTSLGKVYVMKDMGGKVYIKGEIMTERDVTLAGDMGCKQPEQDEIKQYISEASQKSGVDEARIKAIMKQESCFCQCGSASNPCICGGGSYLQSSTSAIGLMQLMFSTAAEVEVNRYDARQNVIGGALYLRKMYDRFGSWELAYAAYNAGPGKLSKCVPACNLNTGSSSQEIKNCACLKKETQNYVPYVSGYYSSCYAQVATCNTKGCTLC